MIWNAPSRKLTGLVPQVCDRQKPWLSESVLSLGHSSDKAELLSHCIKKTPYGQVNKFKNLIFIEHGLLYLQRAATL